MAASLSFLGEAELHGLVDGHVEADRRADILRRLAASPSDRALVEAWQEQNDLIRAAFGDIERETLPVALDLAPPRLRCVDGDARPPLGPIRSPVENRRGGLAAAATLLVVGVGLVGSWLVLSEGGRDDDAAEAAAPRASLETTLADRASAAVERSISGSPRSTSGLPVVRIPDLTNAGLTLASVSTEAAEPVSLVIQYRDGDSGRVVVSVARAQGDALPTTPAAVGKSFAWRRHDAAFAIAGTVSPDRLRAIASLMQDDAEN